MIQQIEATEWLFQESEVHLLAILGIWQNKNKRQHAKQELFKNSFTCLQPSLMLFSKEKENWKIDHYFRLYRLNLYKQ